jgi:hypothetical protein
MWHVLDADRGSGTTGVTYLTDNAMEKRLEEALSWTG